MGGGLNQGYTGIEIAEMIELPPALRGAWHARGYYGSVSHNVKAIYQHYMGWFDGNPAHLWEHPPAESAKRYVECIGGTDVVVSKARGYVSSGDLRFAAQLLNHAVFADPGHPDAKSLLAEVYERLGHGAENGTWRNFYLQGAQELRGNVAKTDIDTAGSDLVAALTVEQVFDSLAIRVNGPKAWHADVTIDWKLTDLDQQVRLRLANGVLVQSVPPPDAQPADLTLTLTKQQLLGMIATQNPDGVQMTATRSTSGCCLASSTHPTGSSPSSHPDRLKARARPGVARGEPPGSLRGPGVVRTAQPLRLCFPGGRPPGIPPQAQAWFAPHSR